MPIAFDFANGSAAGSASSLTYSHTCSGLNRILFVVAWHYQLNPGDINTGVTYNGVAMTLLTKVVTTSASFPGDWAYLYYMINPPTGANNIVISASNAAHNIGGESVSYTGAKQTGQPDASTTNTAGDAATSITTPLTTIANNSWMFSFSGCRSFTGGAFTPLAGTGTTARNIQNNSGIGDSNGPITPAASYSMQWLPGAGGGTGPYTVIQASFSPAVDLVARAIKLSQAINRAATY